MRDGLYRVTTSYLCAGFELRDGVVVACAPILRKKLPYWMTVAERVDDDEPYAWPCELPPVIYRWGNNPRRAELKGRQCVVLARGALGSILVMFLDTGEKVVTSHRAVA